MKRKLRLNAETLKVLSRAQARQVGGGDSEETACVTCDSCVTECDTCAGGSSTDYTWVQCDGCECLTNSFHPQGCSGAETCEVCN